MKTNVANDQIIIRLREKLRHCREQRDHGGHFRRDALWVASWDGKAQGLEMAIKIVESAATEERNA